ncbi:MAG: sodium:proton antiporter [Lactobacillales bacterium]|nr:sodium:proton antiporter [Lactobacillales bacterium]
MVYIILFFLTMIFSNVISRLFPRLPLPLIQLMFGVFFGYFSSQDKLSLNSEIFIALLIAPLLFREGEESDIVSILKHWKAVIFLAFVLVFLTVLSVGFSAYFLRLSIPLAACFAIGAALGPTDLVSMNSLSKSFAFPKWVANLLKGEGLFNDASGIISFQLAISALTYKSFSASDAGMKILVSSIGGILVGGALGWLNRVLIKIFEELEVLDVTGYLLAEILSPFLAFFVAERFEVSGIIAAVTAGIFQAARFKKITLMDAQVDSVTQTVWQALMFVMNALVFTFFGIELERAFLPMYKRDILENLSLVGIILLLTVVLFLTRFLVISGYYRLVSWRRKKKYKRYFKNNLLLTFSGVKGTVSIATILLTPEQLVNSSTFFPYRSMMLLIVAGVTLCTFLIGLIVLPILGEKKEVQKNHLNEIRILEEVMNRLESEAKELRNRLGIDVTIENYRRRVQELMIDLQTDSMKQELYNLRLLILKVEMDGLENAYRKKNISDYAYKYYSMYIRRSEQQVSHHFVSSVHFLWLLTRRTFLSMLHFVDWFLAFRKHYHKRRGLTQEERNSLRKLYKQNTRRILAHLENLKDAHDSELLNYLKADRIRESEMLQDHSFIERLMISSNTDHVEEMMRGYYLERKIISEYRDKGRLTNQEMLEFQRNVNLLESYSLKEDDYNSPVEWLKLFRRPKT